MGALLGLCGFLFAGEIRVAPVPRGERLSKAYAVRVAGKSLPIYFAKVVVRDPDWKGRERLDRGDGVQGYPASIELLDKNAAVRGRGIIDGSASPTHSRNIVFVKALRFLASTHPTRLRTRSCKVSLRKDSRSCSRKWRKTDSCEGWSSDPEICLSVRNSLPEAPE